MNPTSSSVVLLSGGLDSSVAFAIECRERSVCLALTVNYGQRAALPEVRAAGRLCDQFGVTHLVVELPFFRSLSAGALLDPEASLPSPTDADLEDGSDVLEASASQVWVPNRNGVLVHVAAACAEARGAGRVVVGFNREEAATFPDNSAGFLEALNGSLTYFHPEPGTGRVTDRRPG